MKNKIYIFVFILFLSYSCNKDKNNLNSNGISSDSLNSYLTFAQDQNLNPDKRLKFNKKALSLLENSTRYTDHNDKLYKVAVGFYQLSEENDLKKTLKIVLKKAVKENDSLFIAKAYYLLGNHNDNIGKTDSAYYYLLKSEKLFLKLKDSLNLTANYLSKAYVQLNENDYSGCEVSAFKALTFNGSIKNRLREYDAYNLIGICSNETKNYENALKYHKKALELITSKKLVESLNYAELSLNNIGYVYQNLNRHKEAIESFKMALQNKELIKTDPYIYTMNLDNLAYSKFKLGDYIGLPNLFYQALEIRKQNDLPSGVINSKIHLSEFFAAKKDTLLSQKYASEALELAKKTKISGDLLGSLKQLSAVEHKLSSQYSKEYIKINDSIQQEERKAKEKFARIAFETDEIIVENDKLEERNRTLLYFFIGTFALGVLLFVIRTQRAKNRELLLKQQQQKVNEEIYNLMISQQATIEENRVKEKKRIAQELHDGVLGRMFGARLTLDSLNSFTDEESIKTRFNYLNELKNIEQDIREISHDLSREKSVLVNNFVAIVNNLIEEQKASFTPNIIFNMDEAIKWEMTDNTTKINLYRIVQESLQNINKYAQAKNVKVTFKKDIDNIVLKIVDDGIGFDTIGRKKGIGLQNMEARAIECEGVFEVISKKGKGATISISVPIIKNKVTV